MFISYCTSYFSWGLLLSLQNKKTENISQIFLHELAWYQMKFLSDDVCNIGIICSLPERNMFISHRPPSCFKPISEVQDAIDEIMVITTSSMLSNCHSALSFYISLCYLSILLSSRGQLLVFARLSFPGSSYSSPGWRFSHPPWKWQVCEHVNSDEYACGNRCRKSGKIPICKYFEIKL